MAHVALAWIAAHGGHDEAASRVLGWHAASQRAGSAMGPGSYIARSLRGLQHCIEGRFDAATFEQWRSDGATLGDRQAEALVLEAHP
jgi:hypothetical protein